MATEAEIEAAAVFFCWHRYINCEKPCSSCKNVAQKTLDAAERANANQTGDDRG